MERVTPPIGRAFAIGLAAGLLWLITVSLGFGILNVALIHVPRATRLQLFAVLAFVSGVLSFSAIRVLRRARRLPTGSTAAGKARGKRMGMWFGIIFGLEGMIIGIASTVLGATHHGELIVPVAILVVGLHFLPLAWLFEVPAYYGLGAGIVAVTLGTLAVIPASSTVAGIASWTVIPGDGFIVLTWTTVTYLLIQIRRRLDPRGAGERA